MKVSGLWQLRLLLTKLCFWNYVICPISRLELTDDVTVQGQEILVKLLPLLDHILTLIYNRTLRTLLCPVDTFFKVSSCSQRSTSPVHCAHSTGKFLSFILSLHVLALTSKLTWCLFPFSLDNEGVCGNGLQRLLFADGHAIVL